MSYRLQMTIPDDLAKELARRGRAGKRPVSRVAAELLVLALNGDASDDHRVDFSDDQAPAHGSPLWLDPPRGPERNAWRNELWAGILDLHRRYRDALGNLPADWWREPALVELLGALVTWRATIDVHGSDPREELAFHTQLIAFGALLDQRPGGRSFSEDALPAEWFADAT
jgi:hypothetical protein